MGFLDKLLGREEAPRHPGGNAAPQQMRPAPPASGQQKKTGRQGTGQQGDPDEAAVERYRYLLRTAPPDQIEQAHAEAFEKLTPQQRQQVLQNLGQEVPESERATSDDPRALARMATRAEMRQPGTLERSFGSRGRGMGMGMGGLLAGSLLASVAGAFIGSAIAQQMFDDSGADESAGDETGGDEAGGDAGDGMGDDAGGQGVAADDPQMGGDFGGGDFGGGDFGGGDFGGF